MWGESTQFCVTSPMNTFLPTIRIPRGFQEIPIPTQILTVLSVARVYVILCIEVTSDRCRVTDVHSAVNPISINWTKSSFRTYLLYLFAASTCAV